jgi:hypothetical protein
VDIINDRLGKLLKQAVVLSTQLIESALQTVSTLEQNDTIVNDRFFNKKTKKESKKLRIKIDTDPLDLEMQKEARTLFSTEQKQDCSC